MSHSWRPLVLAAALYATVGVGVAAAQTVLVRNAPPGSPVELVFNLATVGSATADPSGNATLTLKLPGNVAETDAHAYVDVCDKMRRVVLIERGLQPTPPGDCERREVAGWFVLRAVTSLLIDVGSPAPMVWLRQGPVPPEWLVAQETGEIPEPPARQAPTGLVLWGGTGFTNFSDVVTTACGNVSDCTGKNFRLTYSAGVDIWLARFLAVEGSFVKPTNATVQGTGTDYRFTGFLNTRIFTVGAKVAAPVGPVRIYARVGANRTEATNSVTQTIDDRTVTVGDVQQTVPGGTQTIELKTVGWGWQAGGGLEGWVSNRFAIYGEGVYAKVKGSPQGGGEGSLNDRAFHLYFGVKVHIRG